MSENARLLQGSVRHALSRRKMKSYERAEIVCRELRYQLAHANRWDPALLTKRLQRWMQVTGKVKYDCPPFLPNKELSYPAKEVRSE
jgi:hypothetical protein